MLYVGVFYVVFEKLLENRQPEFLYFLMVGKLTFIWFSKSVSQAANSLETNRGLIAQLNLPKELFPLSVIHEGLYRQAVVFSFLLIVLSVAGYTPNIHWIWLLPLMLVQFLLIIGCGLLAALLVCLQRDFKILIQLGMIFLLFMSGIFWDVRSIHDTQIFKWLMILNPVAVLIDSYRQVLIVGMPPELNGLRWALCESLLLVCLMLLAYGRLHFWIARRVINR